MSIYKVQIKIEVVILARDKSHAEALAGSIVRDGDCECDSITASEIESQEDLPHGWQLEGRPWGDAGDRTIGDFLSKNQPSKN